MGGIEIEELKFDLKSVVISVEFRYLHQKSDNKISYHCITFTHLHFSPIK